MILQLSEIEAILKNNPNKWVIEKARAMRSALCVHATGEGMAAHLERINHFENADQNEARKKFARSNKDLFERITRPIDKVFSASGGSSHFALPEAKDREFRRRLQSVENGLTLRRWIEQYWKPVFLTDPMGVIFIEVDGEGNAYPTYKSSSDIYTYALNGRHLDYLIIKQDKSTIAALSADDVADRGLRYFRVVDDAFDYLVRVKGDNVMIVEAETFPNHFGHVPAIINSNIPIVGSVLYRSPLQPIVECADEFLRESSVKTIYKLLHGFPKHWKYGSECPDCHGTGFKDGDTCPACKGTRVKLRSDVSDVMILMPPDSKDTPTIAPNVGGYISPPVEVWDKMTEELQMIETKMFETLWGTKQVENSQNETATGRFIDTQPINDRLAKIADAAESIETYVANMLGVFYYGNSFGGASINYGRRFQIESADALWGKYEAARGAGAPDASLNDMIDDYLCAKYQDNAIELNRQKKLITAEPFVHLTVAQVKALDVPESDYLAKLYFGEFVAQLNNTELMVISGRELRNKLTEYVQSKNTTE